MVIVDSTTRDTPSSNYNTPPFNAHMLSDIDIDIQSHPPPPASNTQLASAPGSSDEAIQKLRVCPYSATHGSHPADSGIYQETATAQEAEDNTAENVKSRLAGIEAFPLGNTQLALRSNLAASTPALLPWGSA